ncbi:MAG TPA: hypothetical protein VFC19_04965 [Candidatus Limnocylindrales bacterium]|nr:hypothetical protein [Candidatus Limnocylindrales bacterium]
MSAAVAVLAPEALLVEGAIEAIAHVLRQAGLRIAAVTFTNGSAPLFDFVYANNVAREDPQRDSRISTAFLSVRELEGPVALLLIAGIGDVRATLARIKGSSAPGAARPDQLRGCSALTTHRFSYVHVPDADDPVARHFFDVGESGQTVSSSDVADAFVHFVHRHRAPLTIATAPEQLIEDVVAFCSGHAELLAGLDVSWRREACRALAGLVGTLPRDPITIACLDELNADLPLALTPVRYHALRAQLAVSIRPPVRVSNIDPSSEE